MCIRDSYTIKENPIQPKEELELRNGNLNKGSVIDNVYPNPFHKHVYFGMFSNENSSLNISVYDLQGKLIMSMKEDVYKGQNKIHLEFENDILPGVYILHVNNGNDSSIQKLEVF